MTRLHFYCQLPICDHIWRYLSGWVRSWVRNRMSISRISFALGFWNHLLMEKAHCIYSPLSMPSTIFLPQVIPIFGHPLSFSIIFMELSFKVQRPFSGKENVFSDKLILLGAILPWNFKNPAEWLKIFLTWMDQVNWIDNIDRNEYVNLGVSV